MAGSCRSCRPGVPCEDHFQQQVIALARLRGWRVAHFRPAQTAKGWRTPVAADGKGFPDLLMVRARTGQIVAMELKGRRGQLTPEQKVWLEDFATVPGAVSRCYRPADWPVIEALLK